jgi:hypothetical protein
MSMAAEMLLDTQLIPMISKSDVVRCHEHISTLAGPVMDRHGGTRCRAALPFLEVLVERVRRKLPPFSLHDLLTIFMAPASRD